MRRVWGFQIHPHSTPNLLNELKIIMRIFFPPPPPPKIFSAEFPGSTENSFLRWLCFCSEFFALVGKRLDKKTKVNFKMYDVIDWETNNYTTHSDQYLKK